MGLAVIVFCLWACQPVDVTKSVTRGQTIVPVDGTDSGTDTLGWRKDLGVGYAVSAAGTPYWSAGFRRAKLSRAQIIQPQHPDPQPQPQPDLRGFRA